MGCPGFEPGTNRLKAEYSTVELATPFIARYDLLQSVNFCLQNANLSFTRLASLTCF
jgi:hypothetical protein